MVLLLIYYNYKFNNIKKKNKYKGVLIKCNIISNLYFSCCLCHEISFSKLKCFIDMVAKLFYKHMDQYC